MPDKHDRGSTTKRKPRRHVPVKGASHVYWSERKGGKKVWVIRHPAPTRRYETLPLGTTLARAKELARQAHAPDAPVAANLRLTFAEAVKDWRETREYRPSSVKRLDGILDRHVLPRIGHMKVRDIDAGRMLRVIAECPSQRMTYKTIGIVLRHAVEMGALASVPKVPKKRVPKAAPPRRRVISTDEERNMLAYSASRGMLSQAIRVGISQALRIGELCGLEWDDIEWSADKLTIRRSVDKDGSVGPTKSGKERRIDLLPKAREALLELREQGEGTGRVLRNEYGAPWLPGPLGDAFARARDDAGIRVTEDGKVTPHAMRHTGISRLVNNPGVPTVYVKEFAGHASMETTEGYAHAIENDATLRAAQEAMAA
jgi:integrase